MFEIKFTDEVWMDTPDNRVYSSRNEEKYLEFMWDSPEFCYYVYNVEGVPEEILERLSCVWEWMDEVCHDKNDDQSVIFVSSRVAEDPFEGITHLTNYLQSLSQE